MNNIGNHKINGITQDVLLAILITVPFILVNFYTALFVGSVVTSILLMRRTIKSLNPRQINGHKILNKESRSSVHPRVAVFEISNSANIEILYKYVQVLQMMDIRPKILIIRLNRISHINPHVANILNKVITNLSTTNIKIFLSDVEVNIEWQLKKYNLIQKIGQDNIFKTIDEAINNAENSFNEL